MSQTGKQSPLGVNVLGSVLQNTGLNINPIVARYLGTSKVNGTGTPGVPKSGGSGYIFGDLVQKTALRLLTWSINDAYWRSVIASSVYNDLIDIKGNGTQKIRALGNSKSDKYIIYDPKSSQDFNGAWKGQATTGYAVEGGVNQGQSATWIPYNLSNSNSSITAWGFLRCFALQAWYEFNWNGMPVDRSNPEYKEFTSSFLTANSFVKNTNSAIFTMQNGKSFLKGTFSNQSDLITADIAGISLALPTFGNDLINLGKTIDLSMISTFGLPSNLLKILKKNNAITQSLSLALLSAELTPNDLNNLYSGTLVTTAQEKQIYGAFGIIGGVDLAEILIALNCKTTGLITLADLLDVRKLFPNSLNTITVPVYNISPSPNNSKTYYPIYVNNGINSQILSKSFGDYLIGIIPDDQAQAAGAFSISLQQVKNIEFVDFEKFAQVTASLENTAGLPKTNGTDIPTDVATANSGLTLSAAGSGVYGTYTMSDLFGCMSGLPYPWPSIYNDITSLSTTKLSNIYQQNFLAVTWEKANLEISTIPFFVNVQQYIPPDPMTIPPVTGQPRIDDLYYNVSLTIGNPGGGYGRGGAPVPTVVLSPNNCGASVSISIGTDDTEAASNGGGTYGRVIFSFANGNTYKYGTAVNNVDNSVPNLVSGPYAPPIESVRVEAPPTALLPILTNGSVSTGGVNTTGDTYYSVGSPLVATPGWPSPMNDVVSAYITQANTEISSIYQQGNSNIVKKLNAEWDLIGNLLTIEQRSRFTGIPPVPIISPPVASVPYSSTGSTKDYNLNLYPNALINFVDSIPTLSKETDPHMAAQTLEAISDFTTTGGQSLVGQMRQERNQDRLNLLGIDLDNNIPSELNSKLKQLLLANGTIPNAINGIPSSAIGPDQEVIQYTPPAYLSNTDESGQEIFVIPSVIVNPNIPARYDQAGAVVIGDTTQLSPGSILPILDTNYLGPNSDGTGPPEASTIPVISVNTQVPALTNQIIDITSPIAPGAVNQTIPILPINLNTIYTASTLLPSTFNVQNAIDKVIECNCDCWVD